MSEYQITYWRDLPSMVVARAGDDLTKAQLAPRFQEAIDEAAMRLGEVDSDDYLAGWTRGPWIEADGSTVEVVDRVVADLDSTWTAEAITAFLDTLGPTSGPTSDSISGPISDAAAEGTQ